MKLSIAIASTLVLCVGATAAKATKVAVLPMVALKGVDNRGPDDEAIVKASSKLKQTLDRSGFELIPWGYPSEKLPKSWGRVLPKAAAERSMPPEIGQLLGKADKSMRAFEYTSATRSLVKVIGLLEKQLAEVGNVDPLVNAYLDLAKTYLAAEEPVFAQAELAKVVSLRPGMDLDLRRYSPGLVQAFNEAKTKALAEPRAEIVVESTPKGAQVFMDGVAVGETPTTVQVLKGPHYLRVAAIGHLPLERTVTVVPQSRTKIAEPLERTHTFLLADTLMAELDGPSRKTEASAKAKALADELGAQAVLVTGLAPIRGGYALIATLTTTPPRSIVGTFDTAMGTAGSVLTHLLKRVAKPMSTIELVSVQSPPLAPKGLALDFDSRLLGAGSAGTGAFGPTSGDAPTVTEVEEGNIFSSPWFWIVVGAVAVGAGVTIGVLADPGTKTVQEPDQLRLVIIEGTR